MIPSEEFLMNNSDIGMLCHPTLDHIQVDDAKQYAILFAIEQLEKANVKIDEAIGDQIGDGYNINLDIIDELKSQLTTTP